MIRSLQIVIVVLSFVAVAFCFTSSIKESFDKVEIGSSQDDVTKIMGKPIDKKKMKLPDRPFSGPQESLIKKLAPGDIFEQWEYKDEKNIFYIWFVESKKSKDKWNVIDKAVYPKDAVF